MIDYKLIKELKEAGFPIKTLDDIGDNLPDTTVVYKRTFVEGLMAPTLSELIEACGEEFKGLSRIKENPEKNRWVAFGFNSEFAFQAPEEAVAKLWLKLNETV